jgi:HEAT repeat protein
VEGLADLSYEDRLIWALRHPDGDRAIMAARVLGQRRARAAVPALRAVVVDGRDPYLAAEALRNLVAIEDPGQIRELLEGLASSDSFMVATVAKRALA